MRRRTAVVISAILFAIAHIPNPLLVPVTLVWGAISSVVFLRYRNLYALALAHAIFGMCIAVTVPNRIHRHMRALDGLGEESPRALFFAASRRLMLDLLRGRTDTAAQLSRLSAESASHSC